MVRRWTVCWLAMLGVAAPLPAEEAVSTPPPRRGEAAPAAVQDLPEYHARPLPKDTFKPSEQVSEDYPVAFPVDI